MLNIVLFVIGLGLSIWSAVSTNLEGGLFYIVALLPLLSFTAFAPGWYKKSIFTAHLEPATTLPARIAATIAGLLALSGYLIVAKFGNDLSLACSMTGVCTEWWNTWFAPMGYLALTCLAGIMNASWDLRGRTEETEFDRLPVRDEDLDLAR